MLPARKPQRSRLPQLRNVAVAAVLFGITAADGLIGFYENGRGPLAALPLVAQMIIFLIGEDFILYWSHRLFHGHALWKCHAVLHSSEDLEWISAARFHPIDLFFGVLLADVMMRLAGISPNIFVVLGPITIAHSAFVHANLDWTFGPFKYVIASGRFSTAGITRPPNAAARRKLRRDLPGSRSTNRKRLRNRLTKEGPPDGASGPRRCKIIPVGAGGVISQRADDI